MLTKKTFLLTCFVIALGLGSGCKSEADEALPENYMKVDGRVYPLTEGHTDNQPNEYLDVNSNLVYSHEIILSSGPIPLLNGASSISIVPLSSDTGELPSGSYPLTFKTEPGTLLQLLLCENHNASTKKCERFFHGTASTVLTFSVVEDPSNYLNNVYTVNVIGKVSIGTGSDRREVDLEVKYVGGFSRFNM